MNVFDFDKTIFPKDSSFEFCRFCLKRKPSAARYLPAGLMMFVLYRLKIKSKTEMKQKLFRIFSDFEDAGLLAEEFWKINYPRVSKWYLDIKRDDDVIVSASPEFLLSPVCRRLGTGTLIASRVDSKTGRFTGINCSGEEKVRRFREVFPEGVIENFYSDSDSDLPMAEIAEKAYKVKKETVSCWVVSRKR